MVACGRLFVGLRVWFGLFYGVVLGWTGRGRVFRRARVLVFWWREILPRAAKVRLCALCV